MRDSRTTLAHVLPTYSEPGLQIKRVGDSFEAQFRTSMGAKDAVSLHKRRDAPMRAQDCLSIRRYPRPVIVCVSSCAAVGAYGSSNCAICTAFSAAPLRIWSPTTQKLKPFSTVGSLRNRPTNDPFVPIRSPGMG